MEERPVLELTEARQGLVGHDARYVLAIGATRVVAAFIAVAPFVVH